MIQIFQYFTSLDDKLDYLFSNIRIHRKVDARSLLRWQNLYYLFSTKKKWEIFWECCYAIWLSTFIYDFYVVSKKQKRANRSLKINKIQIDNWFVFYFEYVNWINKPATNTIQNSIFFSLHPDVSTCVLIPGIISITWINAHCVHNGKKIAINLEIYFISMEIRIEISQIYPKTQNPWKQKSVTK